MAPYQGPVSKVSIGASFRAGFQLASFGGANNRDARRWAVRASTSLLRTPVDLTPAIRCFVVSGRLKVCTIEEAVL